MKIILCSTSPRRKELIKKFNLPYTIFSPNVKESSNNKLNRNPYLLTKKLALSKALAGADKFKQGIALGADTIVILGRQIIGKPKNLPDAIRILEKLSGTTHIVCTGFALINCSTGKIFVDYETSKVHMRKLSRKEIIDASTKHLDKAGAYAVQEKDDKFVERIEGDYYNVVGLPIKKIKTHLPLLS